MRVRTPIQTTVAVLLLLAIPLCVLAAWQFGAFAYIDDNLHRRFGVEGASMEPTLCNGDVLAFHKPDGEYDRWQLIMFRFHLTAGFDGRERHFMKRVVGLPNETIEIRDGVIFIDGAPVEGDTYALAPPTYTFEPMIIPEGRYFVLGDNRRNSYDSHQWASQATSLDDRAEVATVGEDDIRGELPADTKKC